MTSHRFFASSPAGLEQLLGRELESLGLAGPAVSRSGVYFSGTLEDAYRVMLWSRIASRVLLPLAEFEAATPEQLYDGVRLIDWSEHLDAEGSLAVDCRVSQAAITHSHYAALKVKDAVVDQFRARGLERPSIDLERPDVRINLFLRKNTATLSLDLSGESLHRRGYRTEQAQAPLKENLAAALLMYGRWPELALEGAPLADPMCGSGTLVVEAGLMACDIAPGLLRENPLPGGWKQHDSAVWQRLWDEAQQRREVGLAKGVRLYGFDQDGRALEMARNNARRAGLEHLVHFEKCPVQKLTRPEELEEARGLLIVNPPYGERMGENLEQVENLYRGLGETLRGQFQGWKALILTGKPELGRMIGLQAVHRNHVFNGPIKCQLLHFEVEARRLQAPAPGSREREQQRIEAAASGMFGNRLKKNLDRLSRWAKKEGVSCYRLYDADMPEYAVAIDLYGDQVHIQEYAAPAKVSQEGAQKRLEEILLATPKVLGIDASRVHLKVRRRQKGTEQYERLAQEKKFFEVSEGQGRFLVNLKDYLDTGLFLDHRPLRLRIAEEASGKRFLNLFCYTASASVHAALGGAASTTSVDMSSTYLDWARRNFSLNGMASGNHQLIRANCVEWLRQAEEQYDLIFLDPPTFSNSKAMADHFDVQRDHGELVRNCLRLLSDEGVLYFSTNHQKFRLDETLASEMRIEDISKETIPYDFERNPKIHRCWRITKG